MADRRAAPAVREALRERSSPFRRLQKNPKECSEAYQEEQLRRLGAVRSCENAHLEMLRRLQRFSVEQIFRECRLRLGRHVEWPWEVFLVAFRCF